MHAPMPHSANVFQSLLAVRDKGNFKDHRAVAAVSCRSLVKIVRKALPAPEPVFLPNSSDDAETAGLGFG